jgi:LytS/YehU family sensor histidine kinase
VATAAQLASLESRVQPHFLFNTLNSISALIPTDPAGAERMTGQLASLMRSSLNADPTALVRLDEELEVVRAYLDIERVRFGDRLRYTVDVPPELGAVEVPRLSLQTLVENSVKYAIAPRREGGSVALRASRSGSSVCLTIEDDGPGFATTDLPEGHGLALLRARLEMTFGNRATLALNSQPGRTTASIEIVERGSQRPSD